MNDMDRLREMQGELLAARSMRPEPPMRNGQLDTELLIELWQQEVMDNRTLRDFINANMPMFLVPENTSPTVRSDT